jgi:hypothetical protein
VLDWFVQICLGLKHVHDRCGRRGQTCATCRNQACTPHNNRPAALAVRQAKHACLAGCSRARIEQMQWLSCSWPTGVGGARHNVSVSDVMKRVTASSKQACRTCPSYLSAWNDQQHKLRIRPSSSSCSSSTVWYATHMCTRCTNMCVERNSSAPTRTAANVLLLTPACCSCFTATGAALWRVLLCRKILHRCGSYC